MDILTVAFATLPFTFEGRHRRMQAIEAGKRVSAVCDTMVVVPNDKLLDPATGANMALRDAFKFADSALVQGVRGISDIIMVRSAARSKRNEVEGG
jgi:cell division protein FtsZ